MEGKKFPHMERITVKGSPRRRDVSPCPDSELASLITYLGNLYEEDDEFVLFGLPLYLSGAGVLQIK